jgi:proteasome accessory factor A
MEWGIATITDDSSSTTDYGRLHNSYAKSIKHLGSGNYFLGNGARFYIDVGSHPEYATPEDISFIGTAANEIAGERHMQKLLSKEYCKDDDELMAIPHGGLHKRLIDDNGMTWGNHENYGVPGNMRSGLESHSKVDLYSSKLALLGIHMATRNIFFGAGFLRKDGHYFLSQKSLSIFSDFADGTTGSRKPLVNLRDEPLASVDRWYRQHVTSGDANMSPWAMRMKLGTTSLVLRLIEHGIQLADIRFKAPLHSITRQVAGDVGFEQRYELKNGGALTAAKTQQRLMKAAGMLATRVSLPEEELWTLDQWDKACADIQQDPLLLCDRSDWVIKKILLERARDRQGYAWNSAYMRGIDRQWDRLDSHGAGIAFRETSLSKWMPDESLIAERVHNPPLSTRAKIRGDFIATFSGQQKISADWSSLRYDKETIHIKDPYATYHARVDELINKAA